jgi:hypothetical protein
MVAAQIRSLVWIAVQLPVFAMAAKVSPYALFIAKKSYWMYNGTKRESKLLLGYEKIGFKPI